MAGNECTDVTAARASVLYPDSPLVRTESTPLTDLQARAEEFREGRRSANDAWNDANRAIVDAATLPEGEERDALVELAYGLLTATNAVLQAEHVEAREASDLASRHLGDLSGPTRNALARLHGTMFAERLSSAVGGQAAVSALSRMGDADLRAWGERQVHGRGEELASGVRALAGSFFHDRLRQTASAALGRVAAELWNASSGEELGRFCAGVFSMGRDAAAEMFEKLGVSSSIVEDVRMGFYGNEDGLRAPVAAALRDAGRIVAEDARQVGEMTLDMNGDLYDLTAGGMPDAARALGVSPDFLRGGSALATAVRDDVTARFGHAAFEKTMIALSGVAVAIASGGLGLPLAIAIGAGVARAGLTSLISVQQAQARARAMHASSMAGLATHARADAADDAVTEAELHAVVNVVQAVVAPVVHHAGSELGISQVSAGGPFVRGALVPSVVEHSLEVAERLEDAPEVQDEARGRADALLDEQIGLHRHAAHAHHRH